jgi:Na+/H+ antiporter NhaD/arsenite permease-like protein
MATLVLDSLLDWLALAVVLLTMIGVAVGRFPWLRMNRATIALCGAALLILLGAIPLEQAYAALDLNTLTLLFAMMIVNDNLRRAGFFGVVASRVVHWARTPGQLLAWIILVSGGLSAIFLNDTIVLIFTPLVLELCRLLNLRSIPFLMALATSANIGSTATITGNPQNMIIGIASGLSFSSFMAVLAPVALGGMLLSWGVLRLVYLRDLNRARFVHPLRLAQVTDRWLFAKSLAATLVMVIALVGGVAAPLAALAAAAFLLVSRRLEPEALMRKMDWSLLVFFAGLFMVTGALETLGVSQQLFLWAQPIAQQGVAALTLVGAILSNLISNVPAVLLFRPFITQFSQPTPAWLTLAMATTLAGNLTLLGSVANLIVAESAQNQGVTLSFNEYLKAGIPITLLTLLWGVLWLNWRFA